MVRRSGSASIVTNGRGGANPVGQNGNRMSAVNRNQLEPSPHELPVKDTDRVIDVASAEREYFVFFFFFPIKISYRIDQRSHEPSSLSRIIVIAREYKSALYERIRVLGYSFSI